jgi:hypothetical protein
MRSLLLATSLLLAGQDVLDAQQPGRRRFPRRWIGAALGVGITTAASVLYSKSARSLSGNCSSTRCVATLSISLGLTSGFLIGREFDQLYEKRYRHAPPMTVRGLALPLAVQPNEVAARSGTLAAAGEGGVELVTVAGGRLDRGDVRARGLRGVVAALPDPNANRLLVGTTTGLYAYPLGGAEVAGGLVASGEVAAMDVRGDRALLAVHGQLVEARLWGDTLAVPRGARSFESRVTDVLFDPARPIAWVLTESALIALAAPDSGLADSLGSLPLPGSGRRIAAKGTELAVAAGDGGALHVDAGNPASLRITARWTGARFAYDVAFGVRGLFIAGGPEGLFAVAPRDDGEMTALGLARGLGFVSALESDGPFLYLLDRSGSVLRRITIEQ